MRALDVDAEHEPLSRVGARARVETRHEGAAELHLAFALLLGLDTVGAEVEERFGAQLLRQLDRDGKPVAVSPGRTEARVEEVLGPEPEQDLPVHVAEPLSRLLRELEPEGRRTRPRHRRAARAGSSSPGCR